MGDNYFAQTKYDKFPEGLSWISIEDIK